MRPLSSLLTGLAAALLAAGTADARGVSRPAPGGHSLSRPAPAARPSVSRPAPRPESRPAPRPAPSHSSHSKPSISRPAPHPETRPAPRPTTRPAPAERPSFDRPHQGGGSSFHRPTTKPAPRPEISRPTTKPAPRPEINRPTGPITLPGTGGRPSTLPGNLTKPAPRPELPGNLNRPGNLTKPAPRPELPNFANRPTTLPGNINRPSVADRPGNFYRPGDLTKPAPRPDRPDFANRPTTLPGTINRPNVGNRPGNRPNINPPQWNNRPGWNSNRPDWGDHWNNVNNNIGNNWNNWQVNNNTVINNFNITQNQSWNSINTHYGDRNWYGRYGSVDYNRWCGDIYSYRGGRCRQVWTGCYGYHDYYFNAGWWGSCWWGGVAAARTAAAVTAAVLSPWWWWRPVTYPVYTTFYGPTWPQQPIVYDPGTNIIIEGDVIIMNGREAGSATDHRRQTIALATPPVTTYPVPEPAQEGQPETWLPLGVWALTQQEEGDAVMFFQLSSDKAGIIAGAYKNVMTGEDQPIVGRIDPQTQRAAWHIGENTGTVYETGVSSLTYDAASVFVHFGERQTQTWLLVRLPSPEMPPGTVKLPEITSRAPEPRAPSQGGK